MNRNATVPLDIGVLLSSVEAAAEPEAFPLTSEQIQRRYQQLHLAPIDLKVPAITSDKSVRYDCDIVYVRAPRFVNTATLHIMNVITGVARWKYQDFASDEQHLIHETVAYTMAALLKPEP